MRGRGLRNADRGISAKNSSVSGSPLPCPAIILYLNGGQRQFDLLTRTVSIPDNRLLWRRFVRL